MAAITRLSLDGYGAKRAGSFAGKEESVVVAAPAQTTAPSGYRFTPGYIAPRRKKKKPEEAPVVVEIAVEKQEVKYVAVQQPVFSGPSMAPVMAAVEEVKRLIEARARNAVIMEKLDELEEEEDIKIIVSQLQ